MVELPETLEAAIAQARAATQAAIAAGYSRLQVELLFPELKPMPVAQEYLTLFADLGAHLKVLFADAGAAALARRDWQGVAYQIRGIEELLEPIQPQDRAVVLVAPTSVEVGRVEKISEQVGDRPIVLLNPNLQNIAVVGVGYAGRQLRERFLNTIETCYYLRPLEGGAILRAYPSPWQVWLEKSPGDYELIATEPTKPTGEQLDQIFTRASRSTATPRTKPSLLKSLQRFFQALSQ